MRRTTMLLAAAALTYALSWLVPVVRNGATLAQGTVPGWEAFRFALSPVWPYLGFTGDRSLLDWIAVISAMTNAWFVVSLAVLAFFSAARPAQSLFWGLLMAVIVDAIWFLLTDPGDLRVGYYLWVGSFLALAVAARLISLGEERPGSFSPAA